MSSSGLDWRPLLAAWLLKRPTTEIEVLKNCFEESFAPIYQWSRQNLHYVMDVLEFNVINQVRCCFSVFKKGYSSRLSLFRLLHY